MRRWMLVAFVASLFAATCCCATLATSADDVPSARKAAARVVRVENPNGIVRLTRGQEVHTSGASKFLNQELYEDDVIEVFGKAQLRIKFYRMRGDGEIVSFNNLKYRVSLKAIEKPPGVWDTTAGWLTELWRPFRPDDRNSEKPSVMR